MREITGKLGQEFFGGGGTASQRVSKSASQLARWDKEQGIGNSAGGGAVLAAEVLCGCDETTAIVDGMSAIRGK
jgi:hypothetical protein